MTCTKVGYMGPGDESLPGSSHSKISLAGSPLMYYIHVNIRECSAACTSCRQNIGAHDKIGLPAKFCRASQRLRLVQTGQQ